MASAGLYVDSYRLSGEPVFSHRHSGLVDRVATRTPSIESIHKDPRYRRKVAVSWSEYAIMLVLGKNGQEAASAVEVILFDSNLAG